MIVYVPIGDLNNAKANAYVTEVLQSTPWPKGYCVVTLPTGEKYPRIDVFDLNGLNPLDKQTIQEIIDRVNNTKQTVENSASDRSEKAKDILKEIQLKNNDR